ncbi:hypothetical protein [Methanothrix sp.]|uniref:hypothetical protein n=1 Tax=Methanothrix sp. TaxID=90426 RepID=UPI003BB4BE8D
MADWESSANVVVKRCLEKLKNDTDIKEDSKEIEDWSDAIKSIAEALTILIKDIKASEDQKNLQEIAIDYLVCLETTIRDLDAARAKKIAESIKKVGEALDVLINSKGAK